jgi:hypothetical protein
VLFMICLQITTCECSDVMLCNTVRDLSTHQAIQQCCNPGRHEVHFSLQVDLGIHPLGHQQLLLQAIGRLKQTPATSPASSAAGEQHNAVSGGYSARFDGTYSTIYSYPVEEPTTLSTNTGHGHSGRVSPLTPHSPTVRDSARQQARLISSLHRAEQLSKQHAE